MGFVEIDGIIEFYAEILDIAGFDCQCHDHHDAPHAGLYQAAIRSDKSGAERRVEIYITNSSKRRMALWRIIQLPLSYQSSDCKWKQRVRESYWLGEQKGNFEMHEDSTCKAWAGNENDSSFGRATVSKERARLTLLLSELRIRSP